MSHIDKILEKLKKEYAQALPDVTEVGAVQRLVLSSPKLNYVLGGGFPIGKIIELFGPESGGKTILASYLAGQFQKRTDKPEQKTVLFVDMEHSFEYPYANIVGLNTEDNFIFVRPLNGEEGFTIAEELTKSGELALIVWDSIAATASASTVEKEYGASTYGKTALLMSESLKKLNPILSRFSTSMIFINQVRAKIGGFGGFGPQENTMVGGWAPKFYASWRARISKGEEIKDKTDTIGNLIKVKNVKSKIGFPKRSCSLDLFYGTGFNSDAEYVDFIIELGMVTKGRSLLTNDEWGYRGNGKSTLLPFLQDHPDIFEKVKAEVNTLFVKHSALDEQEIPDEVAEAELALLDAGDE